MHIPRCIHLRLAIIRTISLQAFQNANVPHDGLVGEGATGPIQGYLTQFQLTSRKVPIALFPRQHRFSLVLTGEAYYSTQVAGECFCWPLTGRGR